VNSNLNGITNKGVKSFIYYIIPFSLLLDILYVFFPLEDFIVKSPLALLKAFILYLFILYVSIKFKIFNNSVSKQIIIFFIYVLCLLPFSSDPAHSFKLTLQVMISLLAFIPAFNLIRNYDDLIKLNKSVVIFMTLIIINFIIAGLLNLGGTDYSTGNEFQAGGLRDAYNNLTYSLLIVPLLFAFTSSKNEKIFISILSIIIFILLIMTLKRIAIAGAIWGFLIYFILSDKKNKKLIYFAFMFIVIIGFSPFYEDTLMQRLEFRQEHGRFSSDFYTSEERYIETFYVWSEISSLAEPLRSLFGLEAFNSAGKYANGVFGSRNLHVDYNLILFTTGLVGLILYLMIYIKLFKGYKYITLNLKPNNRIKTLKVIFMVLLLTSLFTSLGGQMYHISFRLIVFIYMGAIMKILTNLRNGNLIFL
jgi:hypothetical protein